jgi:hypothetical protein
MVELAISGADRQACVPLAGTLSRPLSYTAWIFKGKTEESMPGRRSSFAAAVPHAHFFSCSKVNEVELMQ